MYILLQAILSHLSNTSFDGIDQISDTFLPISVIFSVLFAALIQQRAGSIECMFPAQFQQQWYQVVEQRCWYYGLKHLYHPKSPFLGPKDTVFRQSSKHFHVYVIPILLLETMLL